MRVCAQSLRGVLVSLRILWNVVHQAFLSTEFSPGKNIEMLPFLTPEDLLNPEIKLTSLVLPAMTGGFFTTNVYPGAPYY